MTEGIFATQTEFDRPVFAKLFADRDIGRCHMFIITESAGIGRKNYVVRRRVSQHVVVGAGQAVFHAALNHTGLPELGLEIQFDTIDIHYLTAVDTKAKRSVAQVGFVVTRLLIIDTTVIVTVVIDIDGQFAFQRFAKGMGIVEISRVLRRFQAVARIGHAIDCVCRTVGVGVIAPRNDPLCYVHIRHLKNKAQCIE